MDVDVLIAGYGPVGAALAGLLGGYGIRTLVIDKASSIFMAPRAIALDSDALRILQMVGLSDGDFARVPIPHVALRSPRFGEFARIDTSRIIDGHPMVVTFFQPELERALRSNAERQPTVAARAGVELVEFTQDAHGVQAVLRSGTRHEEVIRARYLVGADGASSMVRAAIGESFQGRTYPEDWLILDALDVPNNIDHVEFVCDPRRPCPHMVAPGGRTRWEFMLRCHEAPAEMLKDTTIAELLRPWAEFGEYRLERKAVYRFHARACARFSKGRVFLAGDAAHVTPPFIGQGLVAGLRDAANLAWKLAWVVRRRASASILESYSQERRPHAAKMIALARLAGLFVMPRSRAQAWLMHGALALLRRLRPRESVIEGFGLKPANAYRQGLFAPGRGRVARGSWFPQGMLRDAMGRCSLSDDRLGPALALICTGSSSRPNLDADTARLWEAAGGTVTVLRPQGTAPEHGSNEDAGGTFAGLTATPWCIVVRPDRTVLHDGPLAVVDGVVRESLALLANGRKPDASL